MLDGETVQSGAEHPGTEPQVMQSAAGYYIGYRDENGMPYSRESGYYPTREAATQALQGR